MNPPTPNGRQSFVESLRNAGRGVGKLIRGERNFRIHLLVTVCAMVLAGWLNFTVEHWSLLLLTIGLVLLTEAINSAIESLVDLVEPEKHPLAGRAKDIAAAAVLIASVISVIIGVLLFGPPLMAVLIQLMK